MNRQFAVRMMHEPGDKTAEVHLYSAIGSGFAGGVSASDFVGAVKSLEPDVHIEMHYNSTGGSPFEAVAMATALAAHKGGYTAVCDGVCASSATIPFSVANERHMRKGSMLMIHEPSQDAGYLPASVTATELKKVAAKLDAVSDSAIAFYEEATGKSRESLSKMMADETWLGPEDAKSEGFATHIAEAEAVAASLPLDGFTNVPEAALSLDNSRAEPAQNDREGVVMSDTPNASEPVENGTTEPDATTSVTADLQVAQPQPQITMSLDEYEKLKQNQKAETSTGVEMTAAEAVAADRRRTREITAKCQAAGIDQARIDKLIDSNVSMEAVEQIVEVQMIATNKPASDGGETMTVDEDANYRKEYQEAVKAGVVMSSTEDEYVNTRRRDDGKSPITLSTKGGE